MIDLPTKNKENYLDIIRKEAKIGKKVFLDAEFKADLNFIEVSCASVLAKVARDEEIKKLSKELGVNLGSGYPGDPKTKLALEEHLDLLIKEGVVRTSWETIKRLKINKDQLKLSSF